MAALETLIDEIVTANRILAAEGVVDAFGHVSARHPDDPGRFLLSRARAPELIGSEDIMVFTLDGAPDADDGRKPYLERFIHGAVYEARPDIASVVHSHSRSVLPFTITGQALRPVVHSCGTIGDDVPVWDARHAFGDTDLLVSDMAMGRDLARVIADGSAALMRGHGSTVAGRSVREAVYTAIYLEVNAGLQLQASQLGDIVFLSPGEVRKIRERLDRARPGEGYDRAWQYWCHRAGIEPAG